MLWGAIASFILAVIMAILVGLGFRHARCTVPEEDLLTRRAATPTTAPER